ncbi:MAG: hypothetical protein ACRDTE_22345 [Pseudonocardiaceae bacterium]
MASPEVARLTRRLDEQDDTVRAVSDTLLDIKETVDQHTEALAAIQATQAQQGETLSQHGEMLSQHGEMLSQHGEMLSQHGEMLAEILRRLGDGRS